MRVDEVAFLHVLQDLIVVGFHPFRNQFLVTTFCPHFSRGCNEHFHFSVGEDYSTDVTTVHHDTFLLTHLLLLGHQGLADKGQGSDGRHAVRHFHGADILFYQFIIQVSVRSSCLLVELE